MELSIKGKQLDIGDALTQHIETRLTDSVEKYFDHALDANVVMTKEGNGKQFRTDIVRATHAVSSRGGAVRKRGYALPPGI